MPHDKNGEPIAAGDEVTIRCKVESVSAGEDACNCTLQALDGPDGEYKPSITCNAKSVVKVAAPLIALLLCAALPAELQACSAAALQSDVALAQTDSALDQFVTDHFATDRLVADRLDAVAVADWRRSPHADRAALAGIFRNRYGERRRWLRIFRPLRPLRRCRC